MLISESGIEEGEWFVPEPSFSLRQGDMLLSRDKKTGRIETLCLVITADCDITNRKFGRQLACLRIILLDEYIRTVWAGRKLHKLVRDETEKVRGQVAKWHAKLIDAESTLTIGAVTTWIHRDEPASICHQLQVPESERKKLVSNISSLRNALNAIRNSVKDDELSQLVEFRAVIQNQDSKLSRRDILNQAKKESLPVDVFLLPSLPQLGAFGATVMLREVIGIGFESVCYRAADAQSSAQFLRIGRLQPTIKYAVSQSFGALHSRIGLPAAYEQRCRGAIESIGQDEE